MDNYIFPELILFRTPFINLLDSPSGRLNFGPYFIEIGTFGLFVYDFDLWRLLCLSLSTFTVFRVTQSSEGGFQ